MCKENLCVTAEQQTFQTFKSVVLCSDFHKFSFPSICSECMMNVACLKHGSPVFVSFDQQNSMFYVKFDVFCLVKLILFFTALIRVFWRKVACFRKVS